MAKYGVHGLDELNVKLAKLAPRVQKNVLRGMVRAGAGVVKKKALANLGGKAGRKDVVVRASRSKSKGGKAVASVGVSSDKFYLNYLETGTAPHVIKTSRKKVLSSGEEVFGVKVHHPGQPKAPFLEPALSMSQEQIIEKMKQYGAKRIEKEAAKK